MKIVHFLLGKANPDRMNGVNKVVHQLATQMQEQNIDVEVWGVSGSKETDRRSYPLYIFTSFREIRQALETLPPDTIIHFHGVFIPVFYRIARVLTDKNIAYIVTPHGALQEKSLQKNYWLKKIYFRLFEKSFLIHSKTIHAISAEEKSAIQSLVDHRVAVIANAFKGKDVLPAKQQNAHPVFGYMGRLDKTHKGLDILIDGFKLYKTRQGKGSLVLIGDGPDREFLRNKAGPDEINFTGALYHKEKDRALAGLDFFIHPSRWDVVPTAVLEAGWHGLPLIVSDRLGFSTLIPQYKAGVILHALTAEVIAECLARYETLYYSGLHWEIGANARKMIVSEYDWNRILNLYMTQLYGLR